MDWTWTINRTPTEEECNEAGDCGFIVCVSGEDDNIIYDHAILMSDVFFEEGKFYIDGGYKKDIEVHGWMLPPAWKETRDVLQVGDELIYADGSTSCVICVHDDRTFTELTQLWQTFEQCLPDPGETPGWKKTGTRYRIDTIITAMCQHSKIKARCIR